MEKEVKEIRKIYEDENIIVLDKPSGLVVNRSNTTTEQTLQDILEEKYLFNIESIDDTEYKDRSGIVHRLDKDTSGVIVIAKNVDSFYFLQKQFKERNVYKEYVALVRGRIDDESIEINAPLARNPNNPLKYAVVSTGKYALTRINRIKNVSVEGNEYTLLKVAPKTGRTHQIRVHLSAIGHSVVCDQIYCANNLLKVDFTVFNRLMLHARTLGFSNPKTLKFQRFEAPLPVDFQL
ncbi:RluA family pseudouridine synthase [candidate division WWE3 bacterium]|uniref:Pseudouridine synthase n=1 Tax=candidate division WWE3 bacterium TaxID=2053526 RepID=A0A7X9E7I3_UNCKA|nr:RluA family pseudouridine synthase [candidate division WWE3 bacterium]